MGVLDKLTVAASDEKAKGYDPVRVRRRKLADALQNQLSLLQATMAGGSFRKAVIRRKRDLESEELYDVEQRRRVVPWWSVQDDGTIHMAMRYGSAKLALKDGKDVVLLPDLNALGKLLPALRQEVMAGKHDDALAAAAGGLQDRFKRSPKIAP